MKKSIFRTLCSVFTVCSILAGCSHPESLPKQQESDLYKSMLGYYNHFKGFQTGSVYMTKSSELDSDFISDYDICEMDPIIVEYIDLYTSPDNVADWDEIEILSLIESDSRLSAQDKERLAYIIAGGYYVQDMISDDKGDSEEGLCSGVIDAQEYADCNASKRKAQWRASWRFIIGLAVALFEPTPAAEAAVLAIYAADMADIEADYQECLEKAEEDLEDVDESDDEKQDNGLPKEDTTDVDVDDDGTEEEGMNEEEDSTEEEGMTEEGDTTEEEEVDVESDVESEEECEEECEEEGEA